RVFGRGNKWANKQFILRNKDEGGRWQVTVDSNTREAEGHNQILPKKQTGIQCNVAKNFHTVVSKHKAIDRVATKMLELYPDSSKRRELSQKHVTNQLLGGRVGIYSSQ